MKKGTTIKQDSNIAKILRGETKGYESWYIRHILSNAANYIITK